jgi:hypothetical protein
MHDVAILARYEDMGNHLKNNPYKIIDSCESGYKGNRGAVAIFKGLKSGLPASDPSHLIFGPQNGQPFERIAGDMDINGDGLGDLVIGSANFDRSPTNNVGGFFVVFGQATDPGNKIKVQCEPQLWFRGLKSGDAVGRSVSRLGDIDGDGCDEFAVGANAEDLGINNQGTVRVVFGWGPKCAANQARVLVLGSGLAGAQAGMAVAGGEDLDGDGIPDMVVGGHALSLGGNTVGAAWVVTGEYLKSLTPEPLVDNAVPSEVYLLVNPTAVGNYRVDGNAAGGQFGRSVAMVPGLSGNGRAGIAVGAPFGNLNGSDLTGGAQLYRFSIKDGANYGIDFTPVAALGGETHRPVGRVGEWLAGGMVNGIPVLSVGGFDASGLGMDEGSSYLITLSPSQE